MPDLTHIDLQEWLSIAIQLLVAAAVGGAVGLEREFHGRWAGLRTHIMVSMGAAVFVMAGMHIAIHYRPIAAAGTPGIIDPNRVVQGIAAGIGVGGVVGEYDQKTTGIGRATQDRDRNDHDDDAKQMVTRFHE